MGWVEDKIKDRETENTKLPALWNSLRDSIGLAVDEFREYVQSPMADRRDCRARFQRCIRISKNDMEFMEIFLNPDDKTIKAAIEGDASETLVAQYRVSQNRSDLEFFTTKEGEADTVLDADAVARLAIEKFLFEPFPTVLIKRQFA